MDTLAISGDQRGNSTGNMEPQSKKQKRGGGDDEKAAKIVIALDGPMYDEATARKMMEETVLVSEDAYWAAGERPVIGFVRGQTRSPRRQDGRQGTW